MNTAPDEFKKNNTSVQKFIKEKELVPCAFTKIAMFRCIFDENSYTDRLFADLDVEFPLALQKAIPKRKAEFLAGRYCAANCLQTIGVMGRQVPIGQNRCPVWPEGVVGSVSHCSGKAVAIVGQNYSTRGIGVDIEESINIQTFEDIFNQIISDAEAPLILADARRCLETFTIAFSAKESFFKAAFPIVNCYFGFEVVELVHIDFKSGSMSLQLKQSLDVSLPKGMIVKGRFRILPDGTIVTTVVIDK